MMRIALIGLVVFLSLCSISAKGIFSTFTSKARLPTQKDNEPYETVAQFLSRFGKGSDLETYKHDEVRRAIKALSKSQSALKAVDGATHRYRNVFKESSSLSSRYEKFLKPKRKKLKEAAKIYEYTRSVERGLQATEILQCTATKDSNRRATYLAEAGLKELKRSEVQVDKLKCIVSVLTPLESSVAQDTPPQPPQSMQDTTSASNNTNSNNSTASTTATAARTPTKAERALERKRRSTPQRYFPGEIIISITEPSGKENTVIAQILRTATREKPGRVALKSTTGDGDDGESASDSAGNAGAGGFMSVQPTYLALACKALQAIEEYLLPSTETLLNSSAELPKDANANVSVKESPAGQRPNPLFEANAKKDSIYIGGRRPSVSAPPVSANNTSSASVNASAGINADAVDKPIPSRIRIVGHSAGGAVGALMAMILDGGVLSSSGSGTNVNNTSNDNTSGASADRAQCTSKDNNKVNKVRKGTVSDTTDCEVLLQSALPYLGLYANRVNCITLGAPPCLSRVTVPRYISSLVCGDDLVPRAQAGALRDLRSRTLKALKSGAGKKGGLSYALSAGLLGDLSSIAGKSLGHYKGKPSRDLQQLGLPGRVFFVKPRQLKEGATIQRVMRGNWQEDMLWQLHNILLSKRMLEHHSLDSYIRTLNRC